MELIKSINKQEKNQFLCGQINTHSWKKTRLDVLYQMLLLHYQMQKHLLHWICVEPPILDGPSPFLSRPSMHDSMYLTT